MDSSLQFHTNSIENIPSCSKWQLRLEGQQLDGRSVKSCPTKRSPRLLLRDRMDKATTKLPIECESVFHFYVEFHDKLLKPAAERLKAVAIMRHHVKIITDRETSHLAHNNDNFCPPCPFKTSSVCAS